MKTASVRCRLEEKGISLAIGTVLFAVIIFRHALSLGTSREADLLGTVVFLLLVVAYLDVALSGHQALWTISRGEERIRMEMDSNILYDGPLSQLFIVDEHRGILTIQSSQGEAFLFPHRLPFEECLSAIQKVKSNSSNKPRHSNGA